MRGVIERYGTALAGLALILFFAIFAPNFASPANMLNVLRETSFLAIIALGFALALTIAELDLSVADIFSQRNRIAKTDAGVAEAVPLAAQRHPDVSEQMAAEGRQAEPEKPDCRYGSLTHPA